MKNLLKGLVLVSMFGVIFFVNAKPANADAPAITVTSPNGGETLQLNQFYTITWSAPSNIDNVWLGYTSADGSLDWIVTGMANTGSYNWFVNVGNTTNTQFKIEAIGYQTGVGSATDLSDNFFTVTNNTPLTINASPAPSSAPSYINAGTSGAEFFRVTLGATGRDAVVNQLTLNLNGPAVYWLSNIQAISDGTVLGTMSDLSVTGPFINTGTINLGGLTIPAGSTKTIKFVADVSPSVWTGTTGPCIGCSSSWYANLTAVTLASSSGPYTTFGLPAYGNSVYIPYPLPPAPLAITTTSPLLNAQVGQVYSTSIEGTGGVGPYSVMLSLNSGFLPPGLSLQDTDGKGCIFPAGETFCKLIMGTPTVAGTYTFTIAVSAKADLVYKQFTLTVDPAPSSNLTIITPSPLPNAQVGSFYTGNLAATGGTGYVWSLASGSLPPGLSICSGISICQLPDGNSAVSGTPTVAGTYTFTISVGAKAFDSVFKQFTLTVDSADVSNITLVSPNSGEIFTQLPDNYKPKNRITWVGSLDLVSVQVALMTSTSTLNDNSIVGWIASVTSTGKGEMNWDAKTVCKGFDGPIGTSCSLISPGSYKIYVVGHPMDTPSKIVEDISDNPFMIVDGTTLNITTPSPLPNATVGSPYTATVTSSGSNGGSYSWAMQSGTLPSGIALAPVPVCLGCQPATSFSGTPTTAGTYTFTLSLTVGPSQTQITQSATRQFTLTVTDASNSTKLIVSDSFVSFDYTKGDPLPTAYTAHISNSSSTQNITYTISVPNQPAWLNSSFAKDALPLIPLQSAGVGIAVDPTGLAAGSYTTTIYFKGNFDNSPASIDVTLNVSGDQGMNQKPIGWIDSISPDGVISGWALDQDFLDTPVNVQFYFDGPAGSNSTPMVNATVVQRDDVNQIFNATGTHGFTFPIPDNFKDGKRHNVYIYAADASAKDVTTQLYGSPKTFVLKANNSVRHPRGAIVIGEGGTVYFLGTDIRYPFPSPEVFFSWGHKFSDLVLANNADLAMPVGPIAEMKQ